MLNIWYTRSEFWGLPIKIVHHFILHS